MNGKILIGDVLEKIKEIPDESVDCIITSPPYWGLRDYGEEGQWGLEMDFHDYLDKLDKLMDECRRVLKKTGTCWVNLGDTYASSGGASRHYGHGERQYEDPKYANDKGGKFIDPQTYPQGVTTKSRMGIPERFYIRCIDKGW